jgi:hypothetical protein
MEIPPPPTPCKRQSKQPFHRLGDLKVKLTDISTSMSKIFVGIKCEAKATATTVEGPPLPSVSNSMLTILN